MILKNENVSEIFPSVFRIKISLPNNPLKFINSYIIRGEERSLLIDTAMNLESCYQELSVALDLLNINRKKLDLFITHIHADHIGLVPRFIRDSNVYMSNVEYDVVIEAMKHPDYWHSMNDYLEINGMPRNILDGALKYLDHVYMQTYPSMESAFINRLIPLEDDETINYGEFELKGILTPGHSPGHMCLYEKNKHILFSGDHILFGITPNISWWPNMRNPLGDYFKSLDKIKALNVDLTFPGHGEPGKSIRERIEKIKNHHDRRFEEILGALVVGPKTAYQVASEITWNIRYDAWESFPKTQKYFALGETISHLIYLEENDQVISENKDGKIIFRKKEF